MHDFRTVTPTRTCKKSYAKHTQYKDHLRTDFNKKCGYCDDLDLINGGKRAYQVDHFVPMQPNGFKVTIASNEYSNLVYACPFCNRSKWNKWPTGDEAIHNDGTVGFVDPCDGTYTTYFRRDAQGKIVPQNTLGIHMYNELNLYLKRHAILWNIERLNTNIKQLKQVLVKVKDDTKREELSQLLLEHSNFLDDLEIEND